MGQLYFEKAFISRAMSLSRVGSSFFGIGEQNFAKSAQVIVTVAHTVTSNLKILIYLDVC